MAKSFEEITRCPNAKRSANGRSNRKLPGLNDVPYSVHLYVDNISVMCPFYAAYQRMIARVYCPKWRAHHSHYRKYTIDPLWHSFKAFRSWAELQNWEGRGIDPVILSDPGEALYSPDTCIFLTNLQNRMYIQRHYKKPNYFNGITDNGHDRYIVRCNVKHRGAYLGSFERYEDAKKTYIQAKDHQLSDVLMGERSVYLKKELRKFHNEKFR